MEDKNNNHDGLLLLIPIIIALGVFFIYNFHQCTMCGQWGFFYNHHTIFGETIYICDNCEPLLSTLSLFSLFI